MVVNAQKCDTPNLLGFLTGQWDSIVYDEGNWSLVYNNKALMQETVRPVSLAQNNCNDRSYSLRTYMIPQMIASNCFWDGCPEEGDEREWVRENIIYVEVTTKVWED